MNRKNRILTMLACLNCVHTTHAVEKSADTQIIAQDNGQESFDKLEQQCKLQHLRILVGMDTGNPDRDAAIQREEIIQKLYAHKKDALLPNDPHRSLYKVLYKELIDIRRDIAKDLSTLQPDDTESFLPDNLKTRFTNKIREWVDSGKMTGVKLDTEESDPYAKALYAVDEHLDCLGWYMDVAPPLCVLFRGYDIKIYMPKDQEIQTLADKYPYIAQQRRDVYRKSWVHDLNSGIKNQDQWIDIGAGLQDLDELNTEIGRDMKETALNTIRENLVFGDQALAKKTIALLKQAPVLKQMVKLDGPEMKTMLTDHKMILAKIKKHNDKKQGPLKKVPGPVLEAIATKY